MPLGNGERYYSPLLGRFLQEDSYVGMPDSPWSLNRYSYTFNNPFKYTDPSGNEGVISDSLKKNSVSEDRGWWTNFFTSFVTGYAYDVYNVASLGMLGTLDVAAQDIQNGKSVNLASAWSRGGSGATLPEIGKNYWTYVKGVGRGVGKAVEGVAHLAYGLATDPANTAHALKEGITDQILGIAGAVQNPQGVIEAIAADPDKAIGNIGEFAGEMAAFEVGGAAVGAIAGRVASPALEAIGRTKAFQAVAGSGFGKVVTSAAKTIGTAHRGLVEWEGRQFAKILGSNFVKRVAQTVSESRAGLAEWEGKQWGKLGNKLRSGRAGLSEGDELLAQGYRLTGGDKPGSMKVFNKVCFKAGTNIQTPDGVTVIEEIKKDDLVLSYNEETGKTEYKRVVRTFINHTEELVKVTIAGESKAIEATPTHPFFVKQARSEKNSGDDDPATWISAGQLRPGDLVRTAKGEWKPVVSVERLAESATVYNFEVEGNHTYFVGGGVLVHNECGDDVALGKAPELYEFADRVGGRHYKSWHQNGLIDEPFLEPGFENFGSGFFTATGRARRIKFNLENVDIDLARGLNPELANSLNPVGHPHIGPKKLITEWELRQVLQHKGLFEKTDFYYGYNLKIRPEDLGDWGLNPLF